MLRDQQFRRIGHLPESGTGHLEDRQFGGGSEAVLDAPQDPVGAAVLAFELEDHIDNVLQDLRTGDGPLLRDVADEDDGNPAALGKAEERGGDFLHL